MSIVNSRSMFPSLFEKVGALLGPKFVLDANVFFSNRWSVDEREIIITTFLDTSQHYRAPVYNYDYPFNNQVHVMHDKHLIININILLQGFVVRPGHENLVAMGAISTKADPDIIG